MLSVPSNPPKISHSNLNLPHFNNNISNRNILLLIINKYGDIMEIYIMRGDFINMYNKTKSLPMFLKISLDILILLGIIVFVWSAAGSFKNLNGALTPRLFITFIIFLVGGLSLLGMLYSLRGVVDSLIKRTPFVWSNVKSLKRISIFSFIISICYALNILLNNQFTDLKIVVLDLKGIHTDIEFLIFFFAGCFLFILYEVFKQAVEFKEENDLTI
jgi:hypothetical protein